MSEGGGFLPLAGHRVLDLTRNVAGPYAAMILGELGADVIKVEAPGRGDDTREWGPPFWEGFGTVFLALNRNKRSLTLDLKQPSSREVMGRLVSSSDVLIESFRPGAMNTMGFGYDWASALNPGLVYCSLTSYGARGPLRDMPGYDPLMQAFGGIMSVTGEEGRPPVRVGVSLVDMGTGMWSANAILAALLQRKEDGRGRHITTALYETALAWMAYHLTSYWAAGEAPTRHGSGTATIMPYQAFPARDGHLVIAAGNDGLFARLAAALGHPEWAEDTRFRRNRDRVENRVLLTEALEAVTREWAVEPLQAHLAAAGVPCSPVRDAGAVAAEPQTDALGIVQMLADEAIPGYRSLGLPFTVDGERPPLRRRPPRTGEHNTEILVELGFAEGEIQNLCGSDRRHPQS
ncbi:MAG: CaiB/BaiF CoA-transferase family protein [Candidatus Dormibacteraceae bacterium]